MNKQELFLTIFSTYPIINELFVLGIIIFTIVKGILAIYQKKIKTRWHGVSTWEYGEGAIILGILYILFDIGIIYMIFFYFK